MKLWRLIWRTRVSVFQEIFDFFEKDEKLARSLRDKRLKVKDDWLAMMHEEDVQENR